MAARIHGGTNGNKRPALDGLFDTLQKNSKQVSLVTMYYLTTK